MVLIVSSKQRPVCSSCIPEEKDRPIKDPKIKKLFNIPKEFYDKYAFLKNIKANYMRYGNLTVKQIEVFKKVVEEAKIKKKNKEKS